MAGNSPDRRRPWTRWLLLAAGLIQLFLLWQSVLEWKNMAKVAERVFSDEVWAATTVSFRFRWVCWGLLAAICLVQFALWRLSGRGAGLRDGICIGAAALGWLGSAWFIPLGAMPDRGKLLWAAGLLAMLAVFAYDLWSKKHKKEKTTNHRFRRNES